MNADAPPPSSVTDLDEGRLQLFEAQHVGRLAQHPGSHQLHEVFEIHQTAHCGKREGQALRKSKATAYRLGSGRSLLILICCTISSSSISVGM